MRKLASVFDKIWARAEERTMNWATRGFIVSLKRRIDTTLMVCMMDLQRSGVLFALLIL